MFFYVDNMEFEGVLVLVYRDVCYRNYMNLMLFRNDVGCWWNRNFFCNDIR